MKFFIFFKATHSPQQLFPIQYFFTCVFVLNTSLIARSRFNPYFLQFLSNFSFHSVILNSMKRRIF